MKRQFMRTTMALLVVSVLAGVLRAQQTVTVPAELVSYPDLIIYNGKIVTMDDATLAI